MRIVGPDGKVRLLTVLLIIMFVIMAIMCIASCKERDVMPSITFQGNSDLYKSSSESSYKYKIELDNGNVYYTNEYSTFDDGYSIAFRDEIGGKRLMLIGHSVKITFLQSGGEDA